MKFYEKSARIFALSLLAAFFCVFTFSCKNSSDTPVVPTPQPDNPQPQVKTSDWLFLFYFDADDGDINDDLYRNIRDIECAFAQIRNADGSPKEGYPSITAIVLWDGISEELKSEQTQFIHPDGALYEIGADYNLQHVPQKSNQYGAGYVAIENEFCIGANTKDLTAQAGSWLQKEPDMSDPETFTNFLKWAKAHYASENTVVCLQDHGAGTHKETYIDSRAGSRDDISSSWNITESDLISRSLCSDETNGEDRLLTCRNITDALKAAGFTGKDKPKILWNDLCLQATAEIVWNYAGYADYYCSSPNLSYMPDYYGVFTNIKSGMSALEVGKVIVSAYFHRYYAQAGEHPQTEEDAVYMRASGYSVITNSFISLDKQKVKNMKNAVDNLADDLLAIKAADEDTFKEIFWDHIVQYFNSYEQCKGLAYPGTFAYLNDLGWLCNDIISDNNLESAHRSATALKELLKNGDDKLIIYAWGGKRALSEKKTISEGWDAITENQMYLTGQKDFISQTDVAVEDNSDCFGMTIVGSVTSSFPEKYNTVLNYDDWTGFSSKWGSVINGWWEKYKYSGE